MVAPRPLAVLASSGAAARRRSLYGGTRTPMTTTVPPRPQDDQLDRGRAPASSRLVNGGQGDIVRRRSRSPPAGRHRQLQETELRGRPSVRSPLRVWRPRDPQRRDDEGWERRRSCSPHLAHRHSAILAPLETDPITDFYKVLDHDPSPVSRHSSPVCFDPMLHEFSFASTLVVRPLSFSPERLEVAEGSPEYRPVSSLWTPPVLHKSERIRAGREPSPRLFVPAPGQDTDVVFGPGVQLDCQAHQAGLEDISAQVTRMEIDAPGPEPTPPPPSSRTDTFIDRVFSAPPCAELPPPARTLRREAVALREPSARLKAKAQRSSSRLAARPTPIPASKRAQHRLIRELNFISKEETVGEDVLTAYIDTYKDTLPSKAIAALRSATRLDNKAAISALENLAEEEAAVALEAA
ncbi:hypothetical protein PVAP13_5NG012677 [Panicum virgatum]|uniref:Uncharacterized protein n=1 Tax=Panicum virgatum TaxID=38727 RepID=A0A8T0S9U8_PANVG|nr:hypothetical protein PVAP13_5NG012677 [Panicum virgatum]